MSNKKMTLFYTALVLLGASPIVLPSEEKSLGSAHISAGTKITTALPQEGETDALKYTATPFFLPADKSRFAIIIVSVEPKYFNRKDMIELASKLKNQFPGVVKLKAGILDDDNLAHLVVTGGVELSDFYKAQRGLYYLDRTRCKEYIQFSARKANPKKEVTLQFKCR